MASKTMTEYHIQRATETVRILNERLPIVTDGGFEYKPGESGWYAYLTGRMSVLLDSLTEIAADTLPTCTCNDEVPGDCRSFGCNPDCEVC